MITNSTNVIILQYYTLIILCSRCSFTTHFLKHWIAYAGLTKEKFGDTKWGCQKPLNRGRTENAMFKKEKDKQ